MVIFEPICGCRKNAGIRRGFSSFGGFLSIMLEFHFNLYYELNDVAEVFSTIADELGSE